MAQDSLEQRELVITRRFKAPRSLVWRTFEDPYLLAQWWGEGYDLARGLARARSFADLNFEQQAELLETALEDGAEESVPLLAEALTTVRLRR